MAPIDDHTQLPPSSPNHLIEKLDEMIKDLADMLTPQSSSKAQEIWEFVNSSNVELPGDWDVSLNGAMNAARQGEAATCAYLAALCYKRAGSDLDGRAALAAVDERARDLIWCRAIEPVQVEVPLGAERLRVVFKKGWEEETAWVPTDKLVFSEGFCNPSVQVRTPEYTGPARLCCRNHLSNHSDGSVPLRPASGPLGKNADAWALLNCAETLRVGDVVDLSQAKRLSRGLRMRDLTWQHCVSLRGSIPGERSAEASASEPRPQASWSARRRRSRAAAAAIAQDAEVAHVRGGLYHVMVYPLNGDFTKALVRPLLQGSRLARLLRETGETLVSQCAKAGFWDLVETLLDTGVEYPDLSQEFLHLCGDHPNCRKAWSKELTAAATEQHCRSLLDLVLLSDNTTALYAVLKCCDAQSDLLWALQEQGKDSLLERVMISEPVRWDRVRVLLDWVDLGRCASLPSIAHAPDDSWELVQDRVLEERTRGSRSKTPADFVLRVFCGELLGEEAVPPGFELMRRGERAFGADAEDPLFLRRNVLREVDKPGGLGMQVLATALILGDGTPQKRSKVVYIPVSMDDFHQEACFEEKEDALDDEEDLSIQLLADRITAWLDPRHASETTHSIWLPVLCPGDYVQVCGRSGRCDLCVPANFVPRACEVSTTVEVCVETLCCRKPLPNVLVHVNSRRAGLTESDGLLKLALLPGEYTISIPDNGMQSHTVVVKSLDEISTVKFLSPMNIFVYRLKPELTEDSFGHRVEECSSCGRAFKPGERECPDCQHARVESHVYFCTNPHHVPALARVYHGSVSMVTATATLCMRQSGAKPGDEQQRGAAAAGKGIPLTTVKQRLSCVDVFKALTFQPLRNRQTDAQPYTETTEWLDSLPEDECVLQLIYTSTPKKVWTLEYVTTDPKSGPTGDVDSARSCRSRFQSASRPPRPRSRSPGQTSRTWRSLSRIAAVKHGRKAAPSQHSLSRSQQSLSLMKRTPPATKYRCIPPVPRDMGSIPATAGIPSHTRSASQSDVWAFQSVVGLRASKP
mmetsp:Transcript_9218/g.20565  ORF Transcript_9218/g.20565 Transcript_9218/m.20565 type:complete len:1033 (+) Transcript_9218:79-3177(+)